jgi:sortase A
MRILKPIEILSLAAGMVLLMVYFVARIDGAVSSGMALVAFHEPQTAAATEKELGRIWPIDFRLWSQNRIAAYNNLLAAKFDKPLAVLFIPKLRLEVPVFDGTGDATLNRGAGRIKGTARPGQPGNVGIAGHRDGFFRGLKDIQVGDQIRLATLEQSTTYVVDEISIVSPDDVLVLRSTPRPSLTLVTCYPFYFVGDAPQRYTVHASVTDSKQPKQNVSKPTQINRKEQ